MIQNMSPRWYIRNFDHNGARMIHLWVSCNVYHALIVNFSCIVSDHERTSNYTYYLSSDRKFYIFKYVELICIVNVSFRSYHDEEHYNSVRLKEDTCSGPARPVIIKVSVCNCVNIIIYNYVILLSSPKSKH